MVTTAEVPRRFPKGITEESWKRAFLVRAQKARCSFCQAGPYNLAGLGQHVRFNHATPEASYTSEDEAAGKPILCKFCTRMFYTRRGLGSHRYKMHKTSKTGKADVMTASLAPSAQKRRLRLVGGTIPSAQLPSWEAIIEAAPSIEALGAILIEGFAAKLASMAEEARSHNAQLEAYGSAFSSTKAVLKQTNIELKAALVENEELTRQVKVLSDTVNTLNVKGRKFSLENLKAAFVGTKWSHSD